jgi:plastocyanin
MGSNGFTPSALSVKPNTKLIFKTNDTKPHLVLLAPGSESPKFFGEKFDITRNQLYQTRLEMPGVYGFYDKYNPQHSLTVTVTK